MQSKHYTTLDLNAEINEEAITQFPRAEGRGWVEKMSPLFALTLVLGVGASYESPSQTPPKRKSPVAAQQRANKVKPEPKSAPEQFVKYLSNEYGSRIEKLPKSSFDLIKAALDARQEKTGALYDTGVGLAISGVNFPAMTNVFWKGAVFDNATFSRYLARIPLIPKGVDNDWAYALGKFGFHGMGGDKDSSGRLFVMYTLGAIALQDRLFGDSGFHTDESKILLKRLGSLAYKSEIREWAKLRNLNEWQAAVSLALKDSLFKDDVFQPEAFQKILEQIGKEAPKI